MIVHIDAAGGVALRDPADLHRLAVVAPRGDAGAAAAALEAAGAGHAGDEGHVWLDVAWLRAAGATDAEAGFAEAFDGMIAYAVDKGFASAGGTTVRAHVVADDTA